ncbi:MAG: LD-carboxypeptidase [Bdellovibrionaceae bacterium]|nr:LD-carboxypeptidase [Pseudobdellovibrionaceae bacterium]
MKRQAWQSLEPGDIVDIVAPASSSSAKDLNNALRFVHKMGFVPRVPKDIFGKDLLCANTDSQRFKHLKNAIYAKDSKVIWSLRGGYGSLRLMPALYKLKKPKHTKLFIGYSDTTALHNFFNQQWNSPSLHGTMLEELGRGDAGQRELRDFVQVLFQLTDKLNFDNLQAMNSHARKIHTIRAPVVGGNLAILASTLGTPWNFSAKGKILALEDIGERGYRVDRMLVQLEQAGVFKGVRSVIFGDFVGGEENKAEDCKYLWRDVQKRFATEAKFPVLKGLPFGHGAFQRPMPFNTSAKLHLGRKCYLQVAIK